MRACATSSAIALGALFAAAVFAACSSGTPTQPPDTAPAPGGDSTRATVPLEPGAGAQGASPDPGSTPTPPQTSKKIPESVADCKEMLTQIANEPPEGAVPMNNATTAKDAGSSDRLQPLVDVIKSKRDGFRCCFDLYAKKNPSAQGRVMFRMKLNPDGSVMEAGIEKEKSEITAPEIDSCFQDLAKSITWARSPSGKETLLTYPFDFKRRN